MGGSHNPTLAHMRELLISNPTYVRGRQSRNSTSVQDNGSGIDYIRLWIEVPVSPGLPFRSLSSGLSSLLLTSPVHAYEAHDSSPRPILFPCLFHDLSHVPISSSQSFTLLSIQKKLTATIQFDVNTPHVVYACLGGFVVLVRSPLSLIP